MVKLTKNEMNKGGSAGRSGGLSRTQFVLLGSGIAVLAAIVGFSLKRETHDRATPAAAAVAAPAVEPVALTAEEENYAQALWSIHSATKVWAIDLSFAGIIYKIETRDADKLGAKVQALSGNFASAESRARAITVPASMQTVHGKYLSAIQLYQSAAQEMLKTTQDHDDKHLIVAQGISQHAAEDMLRVGDVLWPGEYKPN